MPSTTPRTRLLRLAGSLGLAATILLPGAVPAAAVDGGEPVVFTAGTTQDMEASNPFNDYLVVEYEAFGAPHWGADRRAHPATHGEEQVLCVAVAARGQEVAGAIRDSHPQASARHSGADATDGGRADEAGSAGGCGRGDQGVREGSQVAISNQRSAVSQRGCKRIAEC